MLRYPRSRMTAWMWQVNRHEESPSHHHFYGTETIPSHGSCFTIGCPALCGISPLAKARSPSCHLSVVDSVGWGCSARIWFFHSSIPSQKCVFSVRQRSANFELFCVLHTDENCNCRKYPQIRAKKKNMPILQCHVKLIFVSLKIRCTPKPPC